MSQGQSLGELLVHTRRAKDLTQKHISHDTKIKQSYLSKFENDKWDELEDSLYVRNFVKSYAEYLGLDTEETLSRYDALRNEKKPRKKVKELKTKPAFVTTRFISLGVSVLLLVGVMGYILWQLSLLLSPPMLVITHPEKDVVTTGSTYEIAGYSTPDTDIVVNGLVVLTDPEGNFQVTVPLQEGVNEFDITATNNLSKQRTVHRSIIAKPNSH